MPTTPLRLYSKRPRLRVVISPRKRRPLRKAKGAFGQFVATHPSVAKFLLSPKPNLVNYGTITYYAPNTNALTNKEGKETNVRYRLIPANGEHLYPTEPEKLKALNLAPNYLEDDLHQRFPYKPIVFTIQAHVANADDVLDDACVPYKSTTFIPVGTLVINRVVDDNATQQQQIAFSPIPKNGGIEGIVSSNDPLLQTRKGVYWISSEERRSETQVEWIWVVGKECWGWSFSFLLLAELDVAP